MSGSGTSLFEEQEIPTPALSPGAKPSHHFQERLTSAYTKELLLEAPVPSLRVGNPEELRQQTAQRLAAKDVARIVRSLPAAALQLSDAGRVADLKACLADWLRLSSDNEAMGEESVDYDELKSRTRRLLNG